MPHRNLILAQLPEKELASLEKHLVPCALPVGMELSRPSAPIDFLYFPSSGLISANAISAAGEQVEVCVSGREGFSGFPALFDQPQMAQTVVMQSAGEGHRVRAAVVCGEFLKGGALREAIHAFLYLQFVQITQSVLCNRMHEVDARLARCLLNAADRSESENLNLTQEFLSQMLGVQRSTVTVAAGALQRKGLVAYSRGRIRIMDRIALIQTACECYGIVSASYQRILQRDVHGRLRYVHASAAVNGHGGENSST